MITGDGRSCGGGNMTGLLTIPSESSPSMYCEQSSTADNLFLVVRVIYN